MRKITAHRKKSFLGKWLDYYLIIDIPQDELAEFTGVKKFALGFDEGLVKGHNQFQQIGNDKDIRFDAPEKAFMIYGVYFDSAGMRFGPVLQVPAGKEDLSLTVSTKMGLSANKIVISID